MSFIHKSSLECAKSELDLMHTPETQAMILSGKWVDYHPISVLDGDSPIDFRIISSTDEYTDLSQTFLHLQVQIIDNTTNMVIDNNSKVAPANLLLHSMFNQVDVSLNDILVTSSVNTYAYRAMIETLLNYGEDAKRTHLQGSLYYKDTPGQMELLETDHTNLSNIGWIKRRLSSVGRTIDLYGRIHADIFYQNRYLLNNVEMKLRLSRNKSSFTLIGETDNYKVVVKAATLYVRRVKINPDVVLAHAAVLEHTSAKYPIRRIETKVVTFTAGIRNVTFDNISTGALPSRVVLAMVESSAYNGDIKKNPFNFQHFNVSKVAFLVEGEEQPYKALELDFSGHCYIRGYYSLFTGLDKAITDNGNFIEREEYPLGYTMFAFDLTGDLCSGEHFNLVRNGNLRLSLTFKSDLKVAINCIVYMEYQNMIEINKNRQVQFDYTI
jgi:hypothetical protein